MKFLVLLLLLGLPGLAWAQEVVELPIPSANKVVVKLMFRNGSICDPAGKEGLTALTTSLVTQGGTAEMSFSKIQDAIYPMASAYSGTTDKEVSVFTFEAHKDWLEQFYPILRGLMLTPAFLPADFERVKSNQQNYVDQSIKASSDEDFSKLALEGLLFRGNNYQHMKAGTSAGLGSITIEDVRSHYARFYTRHNLTIGVAGNYAPSFLKRLRQDMARLPDVKPAIPAAGKANTPAGIEAEIIAKDNAFGSAIFMGAPLAITRSSDEFAALMVANSYLGEHRKSYGKLYQELREQRSMNYGDYSYIEWYENGGANMLPPPGAPRSSNYFAVWIRPVQIAKQLHSQYPELKGLKIGHAHFALRLALYELDNLVKKGISKEDFETTLAFLRSYVKLYVQTPADRLGYLLDSRFYGRRDFIADLDRLFARLAVQDVNKVMRKYWQPGSMYVAIVTDKSEAETLAQSLRENLPSAMSYADAVKAGLPKEVLDKDAVVENYRFKVKSVHIVDPASLFLK
jgi:zinc protease